VSTRILRWLIYLSIVLTGTVWLVDRGRGWPFNGHLPEALAAFALLVAAAAAVRGFERGEQVDDRMVGFGLAIGVLWVAEILFNNLLHPSLPGRDRIDDGLWALVALLIFLAVYHADARDQPAATGLWLGAASGAVACATGLLFATVGIHAITTDPLSRREWNSVGHGGSTIRSYWAYQTLAGSLLHLVVLGAVMGVGLGVAGGALRRAVAQRR
jgi:hypothetical protein